ncbi:thiosulfate dehydrogenase [Stigmatella aurantiaca]|uniref:Thiosulfate dehydrogenase n=1 Tax=Stigmatella aurantiaca TaxID=41 RepID=A0A1H7Y6E2_STIAU|nr:c-type cytochrome [Stigmatella aurantiaca]SEM41495.1 thiosulfate dehydrogenase [Stigmatella aurantiaca]
MRGALWLVGLLAVGCGESTEPAADFGEALFQDARLSESQYNRFSCATCHAPTPTPPAGRVLAGHTLHNAAFRPSWWGGYETQLLDAVNFCYVHFMRGVSPLTPEEPKSRALYEYLVRISPDPQAPALPFTVVKDIREVPRGTGSRGAEVYRAACQDCHGEPHTGKGRLTERASVLPEVVRDYDTLFPGVPKSLVVIEKVRHGQFFGVGGNMPPYSLEALSDEDLGALLAFLEL